MSEEEGGGCLATVPELPGCMSDGESHEEALENVFDAIACRIEAEPEMVAKAVGRRRLRNFGDRMGPSL